MEPLNERGRSIGDNDLDTSAGHIIPIVGGSDSDHSHSRPRALTTEHQQSQVVAMVGSIDEPHLGPQRLRGLTESFPTNSFGTQSRTRGQTENYVTHRSGAERLNSGFENRWLSDRAASIEGGIVIPVSGGTPIEKEIPQTTMESSWMPQRAASFESGSMVSVRAENAISTVPTFRPAAHSFHNSSVSTPDASREVATELSVKGRGDPTSQMPGLYIAKFAVSVAGGYLAIQLLITFEEVLLPFIFAALLVIILEPLKKFVMRVFNRSALALFKKLDMKSCFETRVSADTSGPGTNRSDSILSEAGYVYSDLREDSNNFGEAVTSENMQAVLVPSPGVQKFVLILAIAFTICVTGRVLWLTAKVFIKAGTIISENSDHYKKGADRLKGWGKEYINSFNSKTLKFNVVLDDLVNYVEEVGSVVTTSILYVALQTVVSFIFLVYMMWSPIKMDSNTTTQGVLIATGRYLKLKCAISGFTGLCVFISLWACGLDLPAAFGFLAFLCNFLPALGSVVSVALPCVLAILDVRKTPMQVLVALITQVIVHFFVDFVVEPVFFGISVEIHSVIVILGIWFFFKVWGVAGMLLSVPLLAIIRLLLKSFKRAALAEQGRDAETIVFLDNLFEGRWMSNLGAYDEHVELAEFGHYDAPIAALSAVLEADDEDSPGGLWERLQNSGMCQKASQFYADYRLLIEFGIIVGVVVCLTMVSL